MAHTDSVGEACCCYSAPAQPLSQTAHRPTQWKGPGKAPAWVPLLGTPKGSSSELQPMLSSIVQKLRVSSWAVHAMMMQAFLYCYPSTPGPACSTQVCLRGSAIGSSRKFVKATYCWRQLTYSVSGKRAKWTPSLRSGAMPAPRSTGGWHNYQIGSLLANIGFVSKRLLLPFPSSAASSVTVSKSSPDS